MAVALCNGTALPSTPTEWARNQHRFFSLLPPPPLDWVSALSKRSGAGYFWMKGHQIFEPTVDENEAAQHSSFARQIIRSKVCPNDSHHRYIWKIYWLGGLWRSAWQNEERGSGFRSYINILLRTLDNSLDGLSQRLLLVD